MDAQRIRAGLAMLDIVFLIAAVGFFGVLQLYAIGCANLLEVKL